MIDIWTFKYEPKTLEEYIATPEMKDRLQKVITELPNVMLFGMHGIGKGTFVNILIRETGADYIKLNASDENSIDNMRDKVKKFATSLGTSKLKIVYLNEADRLTPQAQEMLLQLIEDVHKITRFIFVGNYINKMIPELRSRCEIVEFANPPADLLGRKCIKILKAEGITSINKEVLVRIIKKYYPDMRKIINTLKISVTDGKLERMMVSSYENKYKELLDFIVAHELEGIRKILRSYQIPYGELYEYLFENLPGHDKVKQPGDAIIEISEALYRDYFVLNKEINFMGMVMRMIKNGAV
jgi:replication factor C small subunit